MKLEISDNERLDNWEALINTIDKTDIPIQFVRNINIVFHTPIDNADEQDISIDQLRNDGYDDISLDAIVGEVFKEHNNNIKAVHFYLDVEHVADVVQEQSNIYLKGMSAEE